MVDEVALNEYEHVVEDLKTTRHDRNFAKFYRVCVKGGELSREFMTDEQFDSYCLRLDNRLNNLKTRKAELEGNIATQDYSI